MYNVRALYKEPATEWKSHEPLLSSRRAGITMHSRYIRYEIPGKTNTLEVVCAATLDTYGAFTVTPRNGELYGADGAAEMKTV